MAHRAHDDAAWIFQAQPDEWDIDRFLADVEAERADANTVWLVTRLAQRIKVGDRAFIWRTGGRKHGGVVALARVTGPITELPDDKPEYRLPKATDKFNGTKLRAPIRIERVLTKRLTQVQVEFTPELNDLSILRWAKNQTNFPVNAREQAVLERLCAAR